jgi:glycine/D-amino acid oxidase-like deaminating enzyme
MYEGIEVNKIFTHSGNVHGVETTRGTINCEYFINCGGLVNVTLRHNSFKLDISPICLLH